MARGAAAVMDPIDAQVELLKPKPGELVVVKIADEVPGDQLAWLREHLKQLVPAGVKAIIMTGGAEIETMPKDQLRRLLA